MPTRQAALETLQTRLALVFTVFGVAVLAAPAMSAASPAPSVLTFKTVKVGAPGNPAVGVVPFKEVRNRIGRRRPSMSSIRSRSESFLISHEPVPM